MQFIYAVEGRSVVNAAKLAECGLDNILREPSRVMQAPSETPGARGCIFSSGQDVKRLRYTADKQRWEKSINDKYWVGYWLDGKPTAADLARDNQIGGHRIAVDLSDWLVPCARVFPEGTRMPRSLTLGAAGIVYSQVMAKYQAFCKQAEVLWDDLERLVGWAEGDQVMDAAAKFGIVVEALGFNYAVGVDECNLIELLTSENIERFLWVIVDGPALVEHMEACKKKVSRKQSAITGSGSESKSDATARTTVAAT